MGLLETILGSSGDLFFFLAALPFEGDWEPSTLVFFLAGALVAAATRTLVPKTKEISSLTVTSTARLG
jgi:hypothetical protein